MTRGGRHRRTGSRDHFKAEGRREGPLGSFAAGGSVVQYKHTDPERTQGGAALRSYWERVAAILEEGRPPITYEWYRDFINTLLNGNAEGWMAWVVTLGELAVGVALILGILTGVAFFGALMNMSFLLAGSASTNPVL